MTLSKKSLSLLCCLGCLLAFAPVASAQKTPKNTPQSGQEKVKKPKGPTFRVFCWSDWNEEDLYIVNPRKKKKDEQKKKDKKKDGQMIKLEIYNMSASKPYPYRRDEVLKFYKKTNNEEKPYKMVLKVKIPPSYKKPLVMLTIEKDKTTYMLYDLDAGKFPYGSSKLVNMTSIGLMADLGGELFLVKSMSDHFVKFKLDQQSAPQKCRIAIKKKGETKVVYSSIIMARANKRTLMFFYTIKDEADRTSIKCRSFVDFKPTQASSR